MTSKFQDIQGCNTGFEHAEPMRSNGATCNTYRLRLYGKQHFLKRLKPDLASDPRYVEAFKKEFLTGYNLNHPNLVGYVQQGNDSLGPYMLLDYVDGETLSERLNNSPSYFANKENRSKFLRQLLSCLSYLHSNQVVHLDLKPDNIILTRVGNDVKLLDLGFCYTDGYDNTMGMSDNFAAPEQKDGSGKVDARTDIYAVGKILQLIHPKSPYIYRCINPDKSKRFQSADEMLSTLGRNDNRRWIFISAMILAILFALVILFPNTEKEEQIEADKTTSEASETIHRQDTTREIPSSIHKSTAEDIEESPTSSVASTANNKEPKPTAAQAEEEFLREADRIFHSYLDCFKDSTLECYKGSYQQAFLKAAGEVDDKAFRLASAYPQLSYNNLLEKTIPIQKQLSADIEKAIIKSASLDTSK